MEPGTLRRSRPVPAHARNELRPVACHVFWWGNPEEWLDDVLRFVAQVMTYGGLEDLRITSRLLGENIFCEVLEDAPAGVFDIKSWTFWHRRYGREVPALPQRRL